MVASAEACLQEIKAEERPLASLPAYTVGEIRRMVAREYVQHLSDLVCRRSLIALLGDARPEVLRELAEIVGSMLGWDDRRKDEEIKRGPVLNNPLQNTPDDGAGLNGNPAVERVVPPHPFSLFLRERAVGSQPSIA